MVRARWAVTWVVATLLLAGAAGGAATITPRVTRPVTRPVARPLEQVRQNARAVGQYQKLELTVQLRTAYTNPFDPAEVDVVGRFATPSGRTIRVPGFFSQDYTRSQASDGSEVLTPAGRSTFQVRFAWGEVGTYSYTVTVRDAAAERTVGRGEFTVQAVLRSRLRAPQCDRAALLPARLRRLVLRHRREHLLARPQAAPMTTTLAEQAGRRRRQLHAPLADQRLEPAGAGEAAQAAGEGNGLGRYDQRPPGAWTTSWNSPASATCRLMLCIDSFNSLVQRAPTAMWTASPYNAANGGPCATPADFFTNAEAKRLFKQRLRYLVARWGYSPSVLAWEFWNEVDLVRRVRLRAVAAWHQEMARLPAHHRPVAAPLTTSFCELAGRPGRGRAAGDGLRADAQLRRARHGGDGARRHQDEVDGYGKPHYLGEYGIDCSRTATRRPEGMHLHNGLWASLFVGARPARR